MSPSRSLNPFAISNSNSSCLGCCFGITSDIVGSICLDLSDVWLVFLTVADMFVGKGFGADFLDDAGSGLFLFIFEARFSCLLCVCVCVSAACMRENEFEIFYHVRSVCMFFVEPVDLLTEDTAVAVTFAYVPGPAVFFGS